ncbi:MAG TPA: SWIM zinc finger family protein, partial [Gaiellaceae bacterium]|nr:SWIM zinc finger family protein [Gaiellaceae bacterium]
EHVMTLDWERPLVPRKRELVRACSCHRGGACEHIAALAYAFAEEIDRDPGALLRWRGVDAVEEAEPEPTVAVETVPPEAWEAGTLPEPRPLRPLPVGAVLKRLGPSGVRVGARDLTDVLERAYASFAAMRG